MTVLEQMGVRAKAASRTLANLPILKRNKALAAIADALVRDTEQLLLENARDLDAAVKGGMSDSMRDRLRLTADRIASIASGVREVIALPDPLGGIDSMTTRPNGLRIGAKRVPLGVIGIIFEARPNVTVDAAVLCLKSGNAVILRGGKEAIRSNIALCASMRRALESVGLDPNMIQLVEDPSRETAHQMMRLNDALDVLIPRGGAGLIRSVIENASVPVIQTGVGNCHVYVDRSADLYMAAKILQNAKCSRPSVCNAAETVLVHAGIAEAFLPMMAERLKEFNVELRCDERALRLLPGAVPATEEDFFTEYNDYILTVGIVDSLDAAIDHINTHNTKHSEAIVTSDYFAAQRFLDEVDAAAVYVNASTRFTDGNEFGFGAEIGISTQKLHARGPMGLRDLTTVKYIIYGSGQIR